MLIGGSRDKALCLNLGDPCSNPSFAYFKSISSNKVTQTPEQTMKSTMVEWINANTVGR